MLRFLFVAVASLAMVGGALAADLPRKEPPPVAAPVGKAPVGKAPIGKLPFGKGPVVVHRIDMDVPNGTNIAIEAQGTA